MSWVLLKNAQGNVEATSQISLSQLVACFLASQLIRQLPLLTDFSLHFLVGHVFFPCIYRCILWSFTFRYLLRKIWCQKPRSPKWPPHWIGFLRHWAAPIGIDDTGKGLVSLSGCANTTLEYNQSDHKLSRIQSFSASPQIALGCMLGKLGRPNE